jgi:hypothetical protein
VTDPRCQVLEYADRFNRCGTWGWFSFAVSGTYAFKQSGCTRTPFHDVATSVQGPYLHHAYQYCGSGTTFELPDSCSFRSSMLANRDRNVRDARAVVPLVVPCDILRQRIPSTTPATSQ